MAESPMTPLERDLNERTRKAREQFAQAHSELGEVPSQAEMKPEPFPATEQAPLELAETPVLAPADEPAPPQDIVAAPEEKPVEKVEAAPEETPEQINWKKARDREREQKREIKELRKQMEELRAAKAMPTAEQIVAEQKPADVDLGDPFGYKKEISQLREELHRQQGMTQAEREQDRISQQLNQVEAQYKQQRPDYDNAVRYMMEAEKKRYMLSGMAKTQAPRLLEAAEKFGDSDPNARVLRQTIQNYADQEDISEMEAAERVAADVWVLNQRGGILASHAQNMQALPENVYQMAQAMGYRPVTPEVMDAPAAPAAPTQTAAERVRAQAKASAAGKSLSNITASGSTVPDGPAIRTVQQFRDYFQKDPAGARAYLNKMNRLDPHWHKNLANG